MVLRYKGGKLDKVITRGDGDVGEDVTHNRASVLGIPECIPCKEYVEVRGECVISWAGFEEINKRIEDPYSHPRNLAAGSIRLLNQKESSSRELQFVAFELVYPEVKTVMDSYQFLESQGFAVVPHILTPDPAESIRDGMFNPAAYILPTDGLIVEYNDKVFGKSLGATGHHENRLVAYKWKNDTYKTHFLGVRIQPTRTGILSLTAMFEPVTIDGSKVQKATLHNVDIFKKLNLGVGDEIEVYKANMIIPAIAKNNTQSGTYQLPDTCPCCGGTAVVQKRKDTHYLVCLNKHCSAKRVRQFQHFCARTYMDISGLAGATLEVFIENGFIKTFADIYHLDRYEKEISALDGFGKRSYQKIQKGIEASRDVSLASFLAAFGAPLIGRHIGKLLEKNSDLWRHYFRQWTLVLISRPWMALAPKKQKTCSLGSRIRIPARRFWLSPRRCGLRQRQLLQQTIPLREKPWLPPVPWSTSLGMASIKSWRSSEQRQVRRYRKKPIMSLPDLEPEAN